MASPRSRRQHRLSASSSLAVLCAIAGMALAGCNPGTPTNADQANALSPANTALAVAPADADLPAAAPAPVAAPASGAAAYAYADEAASLSDAFADAPPDYSYDYDGAAPSVWRTHDNYERIVEQTADGPRVYYFAPGADQPFYVQAADYGYGFQGGALVAVYDSRGRQLAPDLMRQRADMAGRFLQRARGLEQAARQRPRQAAPPPNWAAQRDAIETQREHWAQTRHDNPDWQTYHEQHGAEDVTRWAADQVQRLVQAAGVDRAMHDDQRANQDWQAAQTTAHDHHQPPPQPPPPPGPPQAGGPPPPPTPPGPPPAPPGPPPGPDNGHGSHDHGGPPNGGQPGGGPPGGGPPGGNQPSGGQPGGGQPGGGQPNGGHPGGGQDHGHDGQTNSPAAAEDNHGHGRHGPPGDTNDAHPPH